MFGANCAEVELGMDYTSCKRTTQNRELFRPPLSVARPSHWTSGFRAFSRVLSFFSASFYEGKVAQMVPVSVHADRSGVTMARAFPA